MKKTPRDYQLKAIAAALENPNENALIELSVGGGKSLIQACIVEQWIKANPTKRLLMVTSTRELVSQNAAELEGYGIKCGIVCAGLGKYEIFHRVLVTSTQTIVRRLAPIADTIGAVIVDECHQISHKKSDSYARILDALPNAKLIGLTGTPYRLGHGYIYGHKGARFPRLNFEMGIGELVARGYLVPPKTRNTALRISLEGVKTVAGEYDSAGVAGRFIRANDQIVPELLRVVGARKCVKIFCANVEHATLVHQSLAGSAMITGDTPKEDRDAIIAHQKAGKLRWLVSIATLLVGYDSPRIDCVVLLFATKSPAKFVQACGRGLRLHSSKKDCLIVDFGQNVETHGLLDDIQVRTPKGNGGPAPVKVCEECQSVVHASLRICPECDAAFPPPEVDNSAIETYTGKLLKVGRTKKLAPVGWFIEAIDKGVVFKLAMPNGEVMPVKMHLEAIDGKPSRAMNLLRKSLPLKVGQSLRPDALAAAAIPCPSTVTISPSGEITGFNY